MKQNKLIKRQKKYWLLMVLAVSFLIATTVTYALTLEPKGHKNYSNNNSPPSNISVGVAPTNANVSLSENPAFQQVAVSVAGGKYSDKANFTITDLLIYSNQHRASAGLNNLIAHQKLNHSAQLKCEDMVKNNYWSHIAPSGSEPWVFFEKVEYKYSVAGENLAYGYTSSSATVEGWMISPGHRENLLRKDYVHVGFGVCDTPDYLNKGHYVIVVQHFASPR